MRSAYMEWLLFEIPGSDWFFADPARGASEDAYAEAVEAGYVWRPERLTAMGTVPEKDLPDWVRPA